MKATDLGLTLALAGVAGAAYFLLRGKASTPAPGAPSGAIYGTGTALREPAPYAAPAPASGAESRGVLDTIRETVGGLYTAIMGEGGGGTAGPGTPYKSPAEWRELLRPLFRQQERNYAMPVGLLEGIADRESRFRHDIITGETVGGIGEQGIMQLHPEYHLTAAGRLDPYVAIPYAAKYLAKQFVKFGTWDEAIAAYNWGPGNMTRSGIQNAPAKTKEYIAWVHARDYVEGFV